MRDLIHLNNLPEMLPWLTDLELTIDKTTFITDTAIRYPDLLRRLKLTDFNFTRDVHLLTGLPKSLRKLSFAAPSFIDFDFLNGALKYLEDLNSLEILSANSLIVALGGDMEQLIFQLGKLRELLI